MSLGWWSTERTAQLGSLIDAGKTATEVSKLLGVSRCAALGRAHRMGWRFGVPRDEAGMPFAPRRGAPAQRRTKRDPNDNPIALSTRFDPETYAQIVAISKTSKLSLNEVVRELVEWGLEAVREGGAA